jgi:hypothetical protein
MKNLAEAVDTMNYNQGYASNGRDWQSDAVIPLSDKPEDRGLYIVTTLDRFFQLDLEQSRNGHAKGSLQTKTR